MQNRAQIKATTKFTAIRGTISIKIPSKPIAKTTRYSFFICNIKFKPFTSNFTQILVMMPKVLVPVLAF